ncbi:hypothetical protein H0H92_006239 [Tricholoma furcatifolium]|nr:hypothetical protein H0H92_006239 [Tricholoma furcatifolium]
MQIIRSRSCQRKTKVMAWGMDTIPVRSWLRAERAAEAERQRLETPRKPQQSMKAPISSAQGGLDSLVKPSVQSTSALSSSKTASHAGPAKSTPPPSPPAASNKDDDCSETTNRLRLYHREVIQIFLETLILDIVKMHYDSNDEDDIQGAFAKPVDSLSKRTSPPLLNLTQHGNAVLQTSFPSTTHTWPDPRDALLSPTSPKRPSCHQYRPGRTYRHSLRRCSPAPAATASASPASSTSRATPPPPRAVRPASPARQHSNIVSALASALAAANKPEFAGSTKFKLAQYAEAESAYTSGIGVLRSGHLLLVPLHNNRALARLRTGDQPRRRDCECWSRAGRHRGWVSSPPDGQSRTGGRGSWRGPRRRAGQGAEGESGSMGGAGEVGRAEKDLGMLAGLDWASQKARAGAARAAGRCRKMVMQTTQADGGDSAPRPVTPKPKPKPPVKPASLSSPPAMPSHALDNLRTANNAAEAEVQMRRELKDTVDAKLLAGKDGKETNTRAFLRTQKQSQNFIQASLMRGIRLQMVFFGALNEVGSLLSAAQAKDAGV